MEDTTKFLKAWHKLQGTRERNEGQEKNTHRRRIATRLAKRATQTLAP
jgi:hypothetical protein